MVGGFTASLSSVGYTGKDGTHVHTYVCAYLDRASHTHAPQVTQEVCHTTQNTTEYKDVSPPPNTKHTTNC